MMVKGIERDIDLACLDHFRLDLCNRLTLHDEHKPNFFKHSFLNMAFENEGLMRFLISFAGAHLYKCKKVPEFNYRGLEQNARAVKLLVNETAALQMQDVPNRRDIQDSMVASWLIQCLICICEGSTKGEYRIHMDVTRRNLDRYRSTSPDFNTFCYEFFTYHNIARMLTTYEAGPCVDDCENIAPTSCNQSRPSIGNMIGVYDGLFDFLLKIRCIRNKLRLLKDRSKRTAERQELEVKAMRVNLAITDWKPTQEQETPYWYAEVLYQQMTLVYLYRTMRPSKPTEIMDLAINKGLDCLEALAPEDSTQSNALLPLFVLGCASFHLDQRSRVEAAFEKVQDFSHFGNIEPAKQVVDRVWELMDDEDERSWDWEKVMQDMDVDCLFT